MKVPASSANQLYVGIDGGGTKCRARILTADDKVLGSGLGGGANPFHGLAQAKANILQAVEMALTEAGLPNSAAADLVAGVGLAGVNLPSLFQEMSQWRHPFKKMFLTTDLHIACLGAHQRDEGAVMIAGTGSCGYAYAGGKATNLGGHGFPHGDKGSGGWAGLQAIKAVLLAFDGVGPQTILSEMVHELLGAEGIAIVEKLGAAKAGDYAKFAPSVLKAARMNDEVAVAIMREGGDYLSAIADKLWATQPGRMSMIGGFAEPMQPWLRPDIAAGLSAPISQPEFGAVYFAKQQEHIQV